MIVKYWVVLFVAWAVWAVGGWAVTLLLVRHMHNDAFSAIGIAVWLMASAVGVGLGAGSVLDRWRMRGR